MLTGQPHRILTRYERRKVLETVQSRRSVKTEKPLNQRLFFKFSRYESGKRQPELARLRRIATALDVEWEELVPNDKLGEIIDKHMMKLICGPRINTEVVATAVDGMVRVQHPELYEYEAELDKIDSALTLLNADGRQEAVKRIEELTEIPRCRRQDTPRPPTKPQESTAAPPPEGSEGPPEGR